MDKNIIGQRAYELWEKDGKVVGKDLDYWLRAEKELASRELESELDASFPASDPPSSTMREPTS